MSTPDYVADAVLVSRAQQGDWEAFVLLIARYRRMLVRTLHARAVGVEADDLLQEVLVRAWTRLGGLREACTFPAWVNRIAVNTARRWQARSLHKEQSLDALSMELIASTPDPLEALLLHEQSLALRDALLALPEANRRALIMSIWGRYAYQEIAQRFDVPVSTIIGRIQRARQQLLRALGLPDKLRRKERAMKTPSCHDTGAEFLAQLGLSNPVNFLALSKDGRRLVTDEDGGGVIVWDTATGEEIQHIAVHGNRFILRLSDDGSMLAYSYFTRAETVVWELEHGLEIARLPIRALCAAFTYDNRALLTGSWTPMPEDETWYRSNLLLWSLPEGKIIHRCENLPGGPLLMHADSMRGITLTGERIFDGEQLLRLEHPQLLVWDAQTRAFG